MKKIILYIIIFVAVLVFAFQIWQRYNLNQKQVPVLVYHNIVLSEEEKSKDQDTLTNNEFEDQMKYLKDNGYISISLDDFFEWKEGKKDIPEKSVIITFDDGFNSFKYLAQPILQKYDFKATCFLIGKVTMKKTAEYVEGTYGTIGLDEVENENSNITYGSHTFNLHEQSNDGTPIVKSKSYEDIKEDTQKFRNDLFNAKYLAYPYYTYTKDFIRVLREEKYKLAFAGEEEMATKGVDNLKVPRISGVKSMSEFRNIFETSTYRNRYGNGIIRKVFVKIKREVLK